MPVCSAAHMPMAVDEFDRSIPSPDEPLALLGGLSPARFMRRHWQKKPLLVRQAIPGFEPLLTRQQLFALAQRDDVESRLVVQTRFAAPRARGPGDASEAAQGAADAASGRDAGWALMHGPIGRRQLPPLSQPGWTLLVQGVDLHDDAVHALMSRFRFVPDARLDDLMISWASDQGGVGPHVDSYDVFLLQAAGRRRWRIGRRFRPQLQPGVPLKILVDFEPEEEYVLEPGDMLYLPPRWAHDGVAEGAGCMTYSVGFRVPQRAALARELVQRMAETFGDETLYRDAEQAATACPAELPVALQAFARDALARMLAQPLALEAALGEVLTEPKPRVWFEPAERPWKVGAVRLDRRTRMLYDTEHVFINGESVRAAGADAALMRRLANTRALSAADVRAASRDARRLLAQWHADGWLHRVE